jgi:hypothetical protein
MRKDISKNIFGHAALVAGFVTLLSGGVGGAADLLAGALPKGLAPIEFASTKSIHRISVNIPAKRPDKSALGIKTANLGSLIQSSAAYKNGCLAGESSGELLREVLAASDENGVPAELLVSMIIAESNCRGNLVSPRGARGLMQLTPATARALGVNRPHHAGENIRGGAKYIAQQLVRFGGDLRLALAAYNAGPACVAKYGAVPPYRETRGYVSKVERLYSSLIFHTTGRGKVARAA